MSDAYYPTLPGLAYGVKKTPQWSTVVQRSTGGYELRYAAYQRPLYKFTLTYEFLRSDPVSQELQTLLGFFLARQGRYDSFRFLDPTVSNTNVPIGVGDGVTSVFPLGRRLGEYYEPFANYENAMTVAVNGGLVGVLSAPNSTVQLDRVPPAGAAVTWSGIAYRRVRFDTDAADFNQFASDLWDLQQVVLQEVR